jgi:hypothetical protein
MKKYNTKVNMHIVQKIFFVFFVLFLGNIIFTHTVFASTTQVYLKTSEASILDNSDFIVDVYVDTSEQINALDLEISYSPNTIEFIKSTISNSIVSFWQGGDVLSSKGRIHLAGGIFPKFSGTGGLISTLHFKALGVGKTKLSFEQNDLYLADGKGTRLKVFSSPFEINVIENKNNSVISAAMSDVGKKISDDTPPILNARLIKDPVNGDDLIVYRSEDPESGIKSVEMRTYNLGQWGDWYEVKNPILYPKDVLKIELRSINNNGDITVQSITTPNNFKKFIIIIPIIIITLIIVLVYNIKRRKL